MMTLSHVARSLAALSVLCAPALAQPPSSTQKPPTTIDIIKAATDALNKGDCRAAISGYEAVKAGSKNSKLAYNLGVVYETCWLSERKPDDLIRAFENYAEFLGPLEPEELPECRQRAERFMQDFKAEHEEILAEERERAEREETERLITRIANETPAGAIRLACDLIEERKSSAARFAVDRVLMDAASSRALVALSYLLLGRCAALEHKDVPAEKMFARSLELEPAGALPPRAKSETQDEQRIEARAFDSARNRIRPEGGLRLERPTLPRQGNFVTLAELKGDSESLVDKVHLFYRRAGETNYKELSVGSKGHLELPGDYVAAGQCIEYYVQARTAEGLIISKLGDEQSPTRLRVPPAPRPAVHQPTLFEQPAFWVVAGAVLVTGGVMITFGALGTHSGS